jgi:hypothetical protein
MSSLIVLSRYIFKYIQYIKRIIMDYSRNSRGQLNDIVQMSVEAGNKDEEYFKQFIEKKYKIQLTPKSQFKHYDFSFNKIYKIEYKGIHYKLNNANDTAVSVKDSTKNITNVFIGLDKILYFYCRKRRRKDLRFFIYYGFIESNNDIVKKIIYKYIEITDVLFDMIMVYPKQSYYSKEHVLIPISSLKNIDECHLYNNDIVRIG